MAEAVHARAVVELPAGGVPYVQLVLERDDGAVEADEVIVGRAVAAAIQHDLRLVSVAIARNHLQPKAGAEGQSLPVEGKEHGFGDGGGGGVLETLIMEFLVSREQIVCESIRLSVRCPSL